MKHITAAAQKIPPFILSSENCIDCTTAGWLTISALFYSMLGYWKVETGG